MRRLSRQLPTVPLWGGGAADGAWPLLLMPSTWRSLRSHRSCELGVGGLDSAQSTCGWDVGSTPRGLGCVISRSQGCVNVRLGGGVSDTCTVDALSWDVGSAPLPHSDNMRGDPREEPRAPPTPPTSVAAYVHAEHFFFIFFLHDYFFFFHN